jgi:tetratricopeptide (TPR) repeat protein
LTEAGKVVKDSVELPLLEAEVLVARGDADGAGKVLTACRDARPQETEFWCALAALADRGGDNRRANALLDEAVARIGDTVELRLVRLRVTQYTSGDQAVGVIDGLAAGAERFPPDERVRLLRALASAYWLIERPAQARDLWGRVAALRPTELGARLLQFDAALKLNDDPGMQEILKEIQRIEGNGPLEKYGTASRFIWLADRGERSKLPEARGLLAAVAAKRPGWSRVPLALARIDELEGQPELLLEHLKQAVELGDRQLPIVKRVVQLLDERGRAKEADDILRRLEAQAPISNDLQRLGAEVSLRLDVDRALALARQAVHGNSTDYKERVWLARMLSAGGRADAAGEFEAAIGIAPDKPEAWVAYVQHRVRQGGADSARVRSLVAFADDVLADREPLAVALCYELAGARDEAEKRYLAAVRARPADVATVRATAVFYQRSGAPEKAEPFLRRLLTSELKTPVEQIAWARRNLALALGVRPEGPAFEEAIRLLDANASTGEQVDDLRTRALITATRPGRRREVIALFERAEKLKPPAPEHEFLLAQLYEADGNWPKARERLLRLITLQKDNGPYLTEYARGLLRRGELAEAGVWIGRLADSAPNALPTVTLRVHLWNRQGRAADAVPLLVRYAEAKDGTPADPAARALAAADLLDQAHWSGAGKGAADAAERLYVRHKELAQRPDAGLPLAAFYGRHDAPDKALALCAAALDGCPVERVLFVAAGATAGRAVTAAHFATVDKWLAEALAQKPDADEPRFLLATVREQQGNFAEAEAEYRKILARTPAHAGALNNLAYLLALNGKGAEALQTAQRAEGALSGLPPELRDTRAVAHTAADNLAAAKQDAEIAAAEGSVAAHFHLAAVYVKLKDRPKATAALRQARYAGLRPAQLHPLERAAYEALVAELKP